MSVHSGDYKDVERLLRALDRMGSPWRAQRQNQTREHTGILTGDEPTIVVAEYSVWSGPEIPVIGEVTAEPETHYRNRSDLAVRVREALLSRSASEGFVREIEGVLSKWTSFQGKEESRAQ